MYTLKKSLGQHFLRDEGIVQRIIAELKEQPFQRLLEVGPGGGALTQHLIRFPGIEFAAVELDDEKIAFLEKTWPLMKGKIIRGSILDIPPPFSESFTVIGNFPYNISTQIVFRMLEWKQLVEGMVGMFQKEVALRIAAKPDSKDYGILSVLTQAWFDVTYLFDVDEQAFQPPPKVKSGVIRLVNKGNPYGILNERKFFVLVKTAFGQRRKQLRNPLKAFFPPDVLKDELFSRRAENLSVQDYVNLLDKMK